MSRDDDPRPWPALSIPDSVVWVDVEADSDTELVLFNSASDTYHSLDPTAAFLWRSIANGDGMCEIVDTLTRRYEDDQVIARDIRAFVDEGIALGVLAVLEPAE